MALDKSIVDLGKSNDILDATKGLKF